MKTFLATAAMVGLLSAPAFAQMGNIHGNESRGEPFNSSYRASGVDPATGFTPGYTGPRVQYRAQARPHVVKKKKRSYIRSDY